MKYPGLDYNEGLHHHHAKYDWRDDPHANKDIEEDIRSRGWNIADYKFPYVGREDWRLELNGETAHLYTPTLNLRADH